MPRRIPLARRSTVAFFASVALAASACGGSNLASDLAKPPDFAPKDESKCGVTKSQAEPLIVEWPDAARGRLEALLRRGVVAVHYSGCEMEVLGQCTVPGHYGYASFTPKRSNVKMRDADELYANIPAYAVKFEATLEKAGELNVSMTIVGRYEADSTSVRAEDLEGQCDGATHVVSALTVGAFDFFAGAEAAVGAGVAAGDAGAGAKSTSTRETLNQDGDATACTTSKRDDTEPPFGCGALIRIEVVPSRAQAKSPLRVARKRPRLRTRLPHRRPHRSATTSTKTVSPTRWTPVRRPPGRPTATPPRMAVPRPRRWQIARSPVGKRSVSARQRIRRALTGRRPAAPGERPALPWVL